MQGRVTSNVLRLACLERVRRKRRRCCGKVSIGIVLRNRGDNLLYSSRELAVERFARTTNAIHFSWPPFNSNGSDVGICWSENIYQIGIANTHKPVFTAD